MNTMSTTQHQSFNCFVLVLVLSYIYKLTLVSYYRKGYIMNLLLEVKTNDTVKGCINWGIDNLDNIIVDGRDDIYPSDLHHELFNTDYFVIYTGDAIDELESYGVFNAINDVAEWQQDNFGEVNHKDLTEPVQLMNMLTYIIGSDALNECKTLQKALDDDKQLSIAQLKAIKKELEALVK